MLGIAQERETVSADLPCILQGDPVDQRDVAELDRMGEPPRLGSISSP